jgi:hypothetical protein
VDLHLLDIVAPCRLLGPDEAAALAVVVSAAESCRVAVSGAVPAVGGAVGAGIMDREGGGGGCGGGGGGGSELDGNPELESDHRAVAVLTSKDGGGGCRSDVDGELEGEDPAHDGEGQHAHDSESRASAACAAGGEGESSAPSAAIAVRLLAAQLTAQLRYVLEDDGGVLQLTEDQQRRVQLSVGRWRNAGLGVVFNTWRHVLGLIAVHRVGLLEVYHAACREQQLPATAATAGAALQKFLADPAGGAILAAHSGLGPPSAAALACALRATSLAGERYPSLDVVHLRAFEGMVPLVVVDVSDNNIRDEGLAVLVGAVVAVGVALTAFNASCNNLTDRSGDQASFHDFKSVASASG